MPDLTIRLNDTDYGLLKEAADSEYRSVAAYCLYIAMIKARKQTKMLAIHRAKRCAIADPAFAPKQSQISPSTQPGNARARPLLVDGTSTESLP